MENLGRYSLDSLIASGGMAEVHLATDTSLLRKVALKLPHRHLWQDPRARARFLQEGRVVAGLSHENIVHLYDLGEAEGRLYLAMEYIEGRALDAWLETVGPLPPLTAYALLQQLLRGLAQAHAQGVLHRDIKPANLLLTDQGVLKIADFGLSRLLGSQALSLSGQFLGTPRYASPELARGENLDAKSDLFSVGLVALEMLLGKSPISADDPQVALLQIREGRFPDTQTVCPSAPLAWHRVVTSLLHLDPQQRPSAQEALAQLEAYAWERHIPLHTQRVKAFLQNPAPQRALENQELATLWSAEALLAESTGQIATARKYHFMAESLGGIAATKNEKPLQARNHRPLVWVLLAAICLVSTLSLLFLFHQKPVLPAQAESRSQAPTPLALPQRDSISQGHAQPVAAKINTTVPSKSSETPTRKNPPIRQTTGTVKALLPKPALLKLYSRPPYAQVAIDGESHGPTPTEWIALAPGAHRLTLTHESCDTLSETLNLAPAESLELRRELIRSF
jgi:serine/threonine protein kinase